MQCSMVVMYMQKWYGDDVGNTSEEYSCTLFLIQMH